MNAMRKNLLLNTIMSLLLQLSSVICGFVLPKLMIEHYGSAVNGLTQSIAQFLYIVSFLELGVGQVIQSSLYKPLAVGDTDHVSKVIKSGTIYFRKIAYAIVGYIAILSVLFPFVFKGEYDWAYITVLIIAMGVGSFSQYYFGLVDKILLNADQKGYIQLVLQIISNILNVVIVSYLICQGSSIQIVKIVSAAIYLVAPIIIRRYINKHYRIDRNIVYNEEPIKQKWDGIAQHVATVVLEGTDIIVLTLFSTLSNVSIYSVYYTVVSGVRQLYTSASSGLQAMMGALWAKNEMSILKSVFQGVEIFLHFVVVYLFSCIAILIVPFVKVYTLGITDCDYIKPLFASILTLAYAIRCLRTPYNILILAGGHYKQTRTCHVISAILNIVVSIIAAPLWGIVGIALGTLIAYTYQTVWMMLYNSNNLLNWPIRKVIKQLTVDVMTAFLISISTMWIKMGEVSYIGWIAMAVPVAVIGLLIIILMALLFFGPQLKLLYQKIRQ